MAIFTVYYTAKLKVQFDVRLKVTIQRSKMLKCNSNTKQQILLIYTVTPRSQVGLVVKNSYFSHCSYQNTTKFAAEIPARQASLHTKFTQIALLVFAIRAHKVSFKFLRFFSSYSLSFCTLRKIVIKRERMLGSN